jgi:2-amino-4-ketopentanoate thiolase beta subunit
MDKLKRSYIKKSVQHVNAVWADEMDIEYLVAETKSNREFVVDTLKGLNIEIK